MLSCTGSLRSRQEDLRSEAGSLSQPEFYVHTGGGGGGVENVIVATTQRLENSEGRGRREGEGLNPAQNISSNQQHVNIT